jgi:hypothetical protein
VPAAELLVERFRTAVDLWATAVAIKRQALRRAHPELSASEIEQRVGEWLRERPGAEMGDGPQPGHA